VGRPDRRRRQQGERWSQAEDRGGEPSRRGGPLDQSPGNSAFDPITLERGITFDRTFEEWATKTYSVAGDAAVSLKGFRKDISIELYSLQGVKVAAYNLFRCWVSEYTALPELDANANAIAFESIVVQYEGFARDEAVVEQPEF
jgi:phage tail-like protein